MEDLDNKTNNEILTIIKQLEADHEALKLKMVTDYEKMLSIEEDYEKANNVVLQRMKK